MDPQILTRMMAAEGPVVTCLLIAVDGSITESRIDMTPRKNKCAMLLGGGGVALVGQYPEIDCVIMRSSEAGSDVALNTFTLPVPFEKESVRGPILLVRMDEQSEPCDLPLSDFQNFCAERLRNPPPPGYFDADEGEGDEGDKGESEGDGLEGEDGEAGGEEGGEEEEELATAVLDLVSEDYEKKHGSRPSEEQLGEIMQRFSQPDADEATQQEAQEFHDRARRLCMAGAIVADFKVQKKRNPTQKELNQLLREAEEEGEGDEGDEVEDEEDQEEEEQKEEEETKPKVKRKAAAADSATKNKRVRRGS